MKIIARTTALCAPKIGAIALECKLFIIIIIQRSCHSSICRRRTSLQQRQKLALGRVEKACESSRVFRIVRMCTGHERNRAVHVHVLKCSRVNGRIARILKAVCFQQQKQHPVRRGRDYVGCKAIRAPLPIHQALSHRHLFREERRYG